MKKTFITIIAGFLAIAGYSQQLPTYYDVAMIASENEYDGTARTVAMGNAFTALGADLGSIGLNPAGSAVAGYSQMTLTPGLSFSANTTSGVLPPGGSELPYFEREMRRRMTGFNIPNIGFTLNYDTHRSSGLKNITVGLIMNRTASWNEDIYANGTNHTTSFMGAMAYEASNYYEPGVGLSSAELNVERPYDSALPWYYIMGYNSGMISPFGTYDDQYIGASEVIAKNNDGKDIIFQGGPLNQSFGRRIKGSKYDYIINLGANISDFLYIGANFGFSSLDYSYTEYFNEEAIDPYDFEIVINGGADRFYFKDMKYRGTYSATGSGVYGKFGFILTPGGGFRVGAAIQTPTLNTITETFDYYGETNYDDSKQNLASLSPEGRSEVRMVSPLRANFGLAYTLGNFGVISADYELCDYGMMRYNSSYDDREFFDDINAGIKETYRTAHMLRAGAEIKPLPELAIRAGYGLTTSPEEYLYHLDGVSKIKTQNVSAGLGYSSKKSFFADFAVKGTFFADQYIQPYQDYMYDPDGYIIENGYTPEILNKRSLWKVLLTIGWRF